MPNLSTRHLVLIIPGSLHKPIFLSDLQLRPYLPENTGSRPISEVKPERASLVLRFERTWESRGAVVFSFLELNVPLTELVSSDFFDEIAPPGRRCPFLFCAFSPHSSSQSQRANRKLKFPSISSLCPAISISNCFPTEDK
jgi:hypothetical protein